MVLLRLVVKVILRDSPTPGLVRSIESNDSKFQYDAPNHEPISTSFLLRLEKPDEVTLGQLAGLIVDEWKTLRPDQP